MMPLLQDQLLSPLLEVREIVRHDRLVLAVPILPKGTVNLLRNEDIDHVQVITSPKDYNFGSIEQYYQNFNQATDKQVLDIFKEE